MTAKWTTYEEVAAYLLNQYATEFGLERVEGKQDVIGKKSGTSWQIDAKGIREGQEGFVVIECRRYTTSKQNQEKLGGLAYRIFDSGADGGIIVSPLGLQEGAQKVAAAENILNVTLDAESTPTEFIMRFLNKLMIGVEDKLGLHDSVAVEHHRRCTDCGQSFIVRDNEMCCAECEPHETK